MEKPSRSSCVNGIPGFVHYLQVREKVVDQGTLRLSLAIP